ncbi:MULTISPECIES: glycosyltransferase family 25 protein [Rhodomicrobium]|uniref:glycosyltransferase family 25 protein n=1 Tax=Rhodomicrobium TaxID=1068 RepID=UPI000B4AA7AE|nr:MULTISPECIES: glycosyltransferase family 25 protein [Rhodomicrobium]
MIQAFVISLPDAQARRDAINAMLAGNIAYEILDATAGKDLAGREREFCKDLYCARAFREMSLNELACSLSHKRAMERFLLSGADNGLILEDDAVIEKDDFARISSAVQALPNFDILKIGGYGRCGPIGKAAARAGDVTIVAVISPSTCSAAYIVSKSGARKLVATVLPVGDPFDLFLRNVYVHKCSVFETSPWLATHPLDMSNTTIGGDRGSARRTVSFSRNLRSVMFRLRYNTMNWVFNLRRFGTSYLTKSQFAPHPSPRSA